MREHTTDSNNNDDENSTHAASRLFHDDMNDESSPELFGMYDYSVQGIDEVMDGSGVIDYNQNSYNRHDESVCSLGESMRDELLHKRFEDLDVSTKHDNIEETELERKNIDENTDDKAGDHDDTKQNEKPREMADNAPIRLARPGLLSSTANTAEGVWRSMRSLATTTGTNKASAPLNQEEKAVVRALPKKSLSFKKCAKSKPLDNGDATSPAVPRRGVRKSSSFITNRFERTGISPRRGVKKSSSFIANRFDNTEAKEPRRGVKKSSSFRFPSKSLIGPSTDIGGDTPTQVERGIKKTSSFRFPSRAPAYAMDNPEPSRGIRKSTSFLSPRKALAPAADEANKKRGLKKSNSFKLSRLVTPSA